MTRPTRSTSKKSRPQTPLLSAEEDLDLFAEKASSQLQNLEELSLHFEDIVRRHSKTHSREHLIALLPLPIQKVLDAAGPRRHSNISYYIKSISVT
ncbi:uncharacterized protein GLRG_11226 [Colletotrichum graminicola M1.001]|uniref:Uncharacterized protein n=1 Tax=Colletotrichum graminicola (strain M1.001 / M2 / FGSC 10212) TaxID=645133 RepID=E3QYZ4_COLGM|nr:uncharacterized protein GLRG_11226 [Colletotrichum graminicola M1.001]EFQ36082.1 hypothetical protein GLRG_11226 [Colletotrichum graminicola M1.001]